MADDLRLHCPRCRGRMERGYTYDAGHYDAGKVAKWVEGPPERSIWTGLKTKDRDVLPITTYRCEQCGYLESYARPEAR